MPLRGDRGANMLEYVGLVVLVAGVVAVIAASSGLDVVPKKFRAAVCGVFDPGKKNCGVSTGPASNSPTPNVQYRPKRCKASETSGTYGRKITIGPFDAGMEFSAITRRYSNGQILVTIVDGATGSATKEFDPKKVGSDIEVSGEASLEGKMQYGDSYLFKNQAEYDKFKEQLVAKMQMDLAKYAPGPGYAMGAAMKQEQVGEMRPPNITLSKTTIEGSGNFTGTGTGTGKAGGKSPVDPTLGGEGEVTIGKDVTVMHNKREKETTHVYKLSIEGSGGAAVGGSKDKSSVGTGGEEVTTKRSGMMRVVRDSRTGKLKKIKFYQTRELGANQKIGGPVEVDGGKAGGGGTAEYTDGKTNTHLVTSTLEFRKGEAKQRRIAEQWLAGHGKKPPALNIGANSMVPTEKPGADATKFEKLLYNNAQVTDAEYKGSVKGGKLGWELEYGLTFGMEMGLEVAKKNVTQAQYLGAPTDGKRSFVDYKACKAPGN